MPRIHSCAIAIILFLSFLQNLHAGDKEEIFAAFERALALEQKAEYAGAAREYERALALAPRVFGADAENTATICNNLASIYRIMGQYSKAVPLFQKSLAIYTAKLGANHINVAGTLNNLALVYTEIAEYQKAEPLLQRCLTIRETYYGKGHHEVASSVNNLGFLYEKMGQYAKAEPLYQRALKIREATLPSDHVDVADSLNNLAIVYDKTGRYTTAEPLFRRSLAIREAKLGPVHPAVAASLTNLGNCLRNQGRDPDAAPVLQRAVRINEAKLGADHPVVATNVSNLAHVYEAMGNYKDAEQLYKRSLKINEAIYGLSHPDVALALYNLGRLYITLGRYSDAEPLYQRSLAVREAKLRANHPDLAASLNALASLYESLGQYTKAMSMYERSLQITESALGKDHPDLTIELANLAGLYFRMEQYAKAEPLYLRSISICESKLGPQTPNLARNLAGLGAVYTSWGQYAKARPLLQRSLSICEAKQVVDQRTLATAANNLAILYTALEQYDEAKPLYQRSLAINESLLGVEHPATADVLNGLANLYKLTGRYLDAEPLYARCLRIREARLGPEHREVASILNNLACVSVDLGRIDAAADFCDRSRHIVRHHVATVLPGLSEREQLTFLRRFDARQYQFALSCGPEFCNSGISPARSYSWLLNGKAIAQQSMAEQTLLARDRNDPLLGKQIEQLTVLRSELAALSQALPKQGQETEWRRQLVALTSKEQELSKQIVLGAGIAAQDARWIEPSAVREALSANAVLIDVARFSPYIFGSKGGDDYWRPERYVAWLVPAHGVGDIQIIDLGPAEAIDQVVAAMRRSIEDAGGKLTNANDEKGAEASSLEALATLSNLILAPLTPHLVQAKAIVLSPDSNLWLVPWASLLTQEGQYAVERWDIHYVTSGRDLVASQSTSSVRRTTRPRVFADPNYDLDNQSTQAALKAVLREKAATSGMRSTLPSSSPGVLKVGRLPGTAVEARSIEHAVESYAQEAPTLYLEQYALEGVFKVIASPKVVVLSTHGFYLADQEIQGGSPPGGSTDAVSAQSRGKLFAGDAKTLQNPLLRCGLLLAGCNRSQNSVDDGVLTGLEIVSCDLRGTDLVVLSACDTGIGKVRNGEGVAGLRQAFQLAGAKAVVSTLWRIPDRETAALMNDFFTGLASGKTKAAALRDAQLALIKQHRHDTGAAHPIYWAAFTVTGN